MLSASETLKAKSCCILRQTLKQYHPLASHSVSRPGVDILSKQRTPFQRLTTQVSVFSRTVLYSHKAALFSLGLYQSSISTVPPNSSLILALGPSAYYPIGP